MFGNMMQVTKKAFLGLVMVSALVGGIGVSTVAAAPGGPYGKDVGSRAVNNAEGIAPAGDLSDEEIEGILFMREEEKLAQDVYRALYDLWGQPVFQNIASSEQAHMDAIKTLIDRYDLDDPAAGNDVGEFTDTVLQELYDQLVVEGSESLASALRVGAAIEEIDILDLQERMAETDAADVQHVYENLMRGSRNHLRAFASTLERQAGETYEPEYLSQETYDEIISGAAETGGQGGRGGRGNGAGQDTRGGWGGGNSPSGSRGQGDCLQQ